MWRIARDSQTLDLNSSYAYVLYARDFAETCRIAFVDGEPAGFVLGYRRPTDQSSLFIWQVAVDADFRGLGLAGRMLDDLLHDETAGPEVRTLHTTITDDNIASQNTFRSLAKRWGDAPMEVTPLFESEHLSLSEPDAEHHDPERLYEIGPPVTVLEPHAVSHSPDSGRRALPARNQPGGEKLHMNIFTKMESEVRSYSRSWPVVFNRAVGSIMYEECGKEYLDFFSGAGALNYGHNNPELKKVLIDYLADDGVMHSLDMFTSARRDFLEAFDEVILKPRDLDYKLVFPGPGGANAVEAALKLARKVTGRESVINFTNAFHGMTLGALSVTGNSLKRGGAGVPLVHATPMPYDDYFDGDYPDFFYFERLLEDSGSGLNTPAAVIVETVQGEGGINAARAEWLRRLAELCKKHEVLLIIDDVQMGCGRTGEFFSFEEAGIVPDIVCLSKSISGYGIPMALTLIKPELDIWQPGEHNGTFRGIGPAFITGAEAIRRYWSDNELRDSTLRKGARVEGWFNTIAARYPQHELFAKGRGLARGLQFPTGELADAVCKAAFERGLLMETSGPEGEVMKILPALTITDAELDQGLRIIDESVRAVLGEPDLEAAERTRAESINEENKEHTHA